MARDNASEDVLLRAQAARAAGVLKEAAAKSETDVSVTMASTAMLIEKGT